MDTGATLSVIPRTVLESLGIGPARSVVEADATPCRVLFGEAEDVVVLGLTALEQLGLAVDPIGRRLVPGRFLF